MENYLFWSAIFDVTIINVISNSCYIILNFKLIREKNILCWSIIHCNLFSHNMIIDKIINCIYLDLGFKLTRNKYLIIYIREILLLMKLAISTIV